VLLLVLTGMFLHWLIVCDKALVGDVLHTFSGRLGFTEDPRRSLQ